jgi:hypothetical protein
MMNSPVVMTTESPESGLLSRSPPHVVADDQRSQYDHARPSATLASPQLST